MTRPITPESAKTIGRIAGVLLLLQTILAPLVYTPAGMMGSVFRRGFLETAAGSAMQIRVAVLLTYVLSALTLAVALVVLPVLRRVSERMAFLFLALSATGLATRAIESIVIGDMLAMSLMYAKSGAPKDLLETLGNLTFSSWFSAHYTNLMLGHLKAFVFVVILYRFALVPRALAAVGAAAAFGSTIAVTMPLLGYRFVFWAVVPTALAQLALTLWLTVKGFTEPKDLSAETDDRIEEVKVKS